MRRLIRSTTVCDSDTARITPYADETYEANFSSYTSVVVSVSAGRKRCVFTSCTLNVQHEASVALLGSKDHTLPFASGFESTDVHAGWKPHARLLAYHWY